MFYSPLYRIPPIALTQAERVRHEGATSPSYGSLRESQLAKRFLDGPSSYREKGSNQIKKWSRVRFASPGEEQHSAEKSSSLAEILSTQPQSSFVDTEYSLQQENVLSTSLTGLELLQRGLSVDDRTPDASHLSSWSSSGASNTCDNNAEEEVTNNNSDMHNNMSPLPDDDDEEEEEEEHDESPMFDLDME